MGVSLERVQFKFASIIGELCSDPDILSQFAVWLDLRLAEYKLKGAISLECSGEEPDPIWLKGLNKGRRQGQITHSKFERHDRNRLSGDSSSCGTYSTYDPIPTAHSPHDLGSHPGAVSRDHRQSDSPDIVVVKEESSDVFPVSLHSHVNTNSNVLEEGGGIGHKRSPFSGSNDHWSQDSHGQNSKRRRTTAADIESPSNQSLMSVLGVTDTSETVASAVSNSSVAPSASCGVNVTSPIASTSTVNPQADMSEDFANTSFNDSESFQDMSWLDNSGMSADNNDSGTSGNVGTGAASSSRFSVDCGAGVANMVLFYTDGTMQPLYYRSRKEELLRRKMIRAAIPNADHLPKASVKNIITCVRTFERWLNDGPYGETRKLYQIPSEDLDRYLAEFYATIKTPQGTEYKLQSKLCIRSNIDRYLRDNNYPVSIVSSPAFVKSRTAYKEWAAASKHSEYVVH